MFRNNDTKGNYRKVKLKMYSLYSELDPRMYDRQSYLWTIVPYGYADRGCLIDSKTPVFGPCMAKAAGG